MEKYIILKRKSALKELGLQTLCIMRHLHEEQGKISKLGEFVKKKNSNYSTHNHEAAFFVGESLKFSSCWKRLDLIDNKIRYFLNSKDLFKSSNIFKHFVINTVQIKIRNKCFSNITKKKPK